jgi:hypothetical protein
MVASVCSFCILGIGSGDKPDLTDEMDFALIIGNLGNWDTPIRTGRYYPQFKIIAVDHWTGEEEVERMVDVLSHEFIHHLLHTKFDDEAGIALDHIRDMTDYEVQMVQWFGAKGAWNYLSPVAKFAMKCAALDGEDNTLGNGVL